LAAAGFAAALKAHLNGLYVLMVEKEPLSGGTTAYSAGSCGSPATRGKPRQPSQNRRRQPSATSCTTLAID